MSYARTEQAALDAIARIGYLTIAHHPVLGDICGSKATSDAALARLVRKGVLDCETFADKEGRKFTIFAPFGLLRLPAWAVYRLPPRYRRNGAAPTT